MVEGIRGRGKRIVILRDLSVIYYRMFKTILSPRIRKKVDAYVSVSPLCRAWFSKEYNVDYDRILFIP